MPSISIKRVTKYSDAKHYRQIFYKKFKVIVPASYFMNSKSYLMRLKGQTIGGYIIAPKRISRVYRQIPKNDDGSKALTEIHRLGDNFAELTGYFIDEKKYGFLLVTHWLINILLYPAKYFIYSYDMENLKLVEYYSHGKPKLIFKGLINNINGMHDIYWERIELLSKLGFCRLYLRRLLRKNKKVRIYGTTVKTEKQ